MYIRGEISPPVDGSVKGHVVTVQVVVPEKHAKRVLQQLVDTAHDLATDVDAPF